MGHFATGVTVVTALNPSGQRCGLTANAVTSVSLHPLLILVCVDRTSASHECILEAGAFAVSVLGAEEEALARRFSEVEREERFEGLSLRKARTGSPILADALAWIDCRLWRAVEAGDHTIMVGEVVDCDAREGDPLVFFRGEYRRMTT